MPDPIDTHPVRMTWFAALSTAVGVAFLTCVTESGLPVRAWLPESLGGGIGMFMAMTILRRWRARRDGGGASA